MLTGSKEPACLPVPMLLPSKAVQLFIKPTQSLRGSVTSIVGLLLIKWEGIRTDSFHTYSDWLTTKAVM